MVTTLCANESCSNFTWNFYYDVYFVLCLEFVCWNFVFVSLSLSLLWFFFGTCSVICLLFSFFCIYLFIFPLFLSLAEVLHFIFVIQYMVLFYILNHYSMPGIIITQSKNMNRSKMFNFLSLRFILFYPFDIVSLQFLPHGMCLVVRKACKRISQWNFSGA